MYFHFEIAIDLLSCIYVCGREERKESDGYLKVV